jgi:hypothetical protein
MPKPKKKTAPAKKKSLTGKKKPVVAKQIAIGVPTRKPTGKTGQQPALTREGIHVALGEQLTAKRGDETEERAAIASAINAFMQLAIASGAAANTSAYAASCPEFFWEGDGANPPVYARVPDATHDEIGRWFQLIVEGVRAYDAQVGATA